MKMSSPRGDWYRSWHRKILLVTIVGITLGACAGKNDDQEILDRLAEASNIHFPSRPAIVKASRSGDWNGNEHVELVVDIPSRDLPGFEKLSALSPPSAGVSKEWMAASLKEKELADVLRAGKLEDFQEYNQGPPDTCGVPGVVVQRLYNGKDRVYIEMTCL